MFYEKNHMLKEEEDAHCTPVIHIEFHHKGKYMLTCDKEGILAVLRGINVIAVYQNESPVTHAIFSDIKLGSKED